jgi:hypothetical protein
MTLRMGGELHFAPIGENPQRILDLGTGTGIWAIDMGDKVRFYPSLCLLIPATTLTLIANFGLVPVCRNPRQ